VSELSTPIAVQHRLEAIEHDLAVLQNELEVAALAWFRKKRDRELAESEMFARTEGTAVARKLTADAAGAVIGCEEEAVWEAKRAVIRVLETRANVGMALLKSMGRS